MTMAGSGEDEPNARDPSTRKPRVDLQLTPSLQSEIIGALKVCGSIKTACVACGIPWGTARRWMEKGAAGISPYDEFRAVMTATKAQRDVVLDGYIFKAARLGSWQAAAHLRDRRSAAQKARDKLPPPPTGEAMVLVYPVAVAEGAELSPAQLPPGHAIDTEGHSVEQPVGEDPDLYDDD